MGQFYNTPFRPLPGSSGASFNCAAAATSSGLLALESTALNRAWNAAGIGPAGRAIRIASGAADEFSIKLGSSTIDAASSDGMLILGGTVEEFAIQPNQTYISFKSSTDVLFNITLGTGA